MNRSSLCRVVFLAPMILTGCFLFSKGGGRSEEFGAKRRDKEAVVVRTVLAKREMASMPLEATVSLEGLRQVDVFSRVAGRLASVNFREGDAVKQGQVLFKVDRTDPGETFLATPVESPVNGWVARWNETLGAQVTTQSAVVQIVDDHLLRSTVSLPAKNWMLISMRTDVTVEASGQARKAKVVSVSRAADPVSGRGTFEVEIENSGRGWRAGMVGTAKIMVEPKLRILLPAQSIILTDKGAFLYSVENGVAQRKSVTYEMVNNDTVEITSGLDGDTEVVTSGNNLLSNGTAVRVLNEKKDKAENSEQPTRRRP